MSATARPTPSTNAALQVISDVAATLAAGGEIVAKVTDILERLRTALAAEECALWLYGGTGLVCPALAGTAVTTAQEVATRLNETGTESGLVARKLLANAERLGAITVRRAAPLPPDGELLLGIVANLLAPDLAHAESHHRLREQVEQRTRQIDEERRFTQTIIDSLPLGLYVIDREYRVQAWNRHRETGYQGVSREQALGRPIFEVLHRQPAESLRKEFDAVFESGRIQQFNIESTASGSPRTFRISKVPMRMNGGPVTHVIAIGEDLTDWSAAQERFAKSEKLAALGQLAAGVMHEINNPLATIAACSESLKLRLVDMRQAGCDVPPQADEFARIIENEVLRCKRIVEGLLDLSRPRSVKKELVNVGAMIEHTVFLLQHHVRFKHVYVHPLLDLGVDPVIGNSEQLIQVFMALLINAADAMNGAGNITVRTRRGISRGEAVVAEVIDEGHGIERSDLPRIFEPFYTTKPPGRGTGLGLSICYSIIAEHGGRIEVDSAVGAGSTFRILLPAADPAAADA
jgi:two-component system NtrC family sensor kinase